MSWTLRDQLTRGYPFEVMPEDRPRLERAARRYVADPRLSKAERDLIALHWLPAEPEEPEPIPFAFPEGSGR